MKSALTRAYDSARVKWGLSASEIAVNERYRKITLKLGTKAIIGRFDPYTPKNKILSWIGRQVIDSKKRAATAYREGLAKKQKPLF